MRAAAAEASGPAAAASTSPGIPWATVVAFAAVLAYADGFWMVSVRGAAGAIERVGTPFEAWVRESSLSLPWFVMAVLAAFALSLRWAAARRRRCSTVTTALLVVAAGTLVGVAELTASAAYDYHLQWSMSREMQEMRGSCPDGCLAAEHRATVSLQLRAVAYGAVIVLVSNLVLVGWLWALRGGRLDPGVVTASAPRRRARPGRRPRWLARTSGADDLRFLLAACLVGGAGVHAAVIPEHLTEGWSVGLFFVLLTAAQLAAGLVVLRGCGSPGLLLAGVVTAVPLAVWAVSRTTGLPVGPEPGVREPVGMSDLAVLVLEGATLLLVAGCARAGGGLRGRPAVRSHTAALAVVAVACVTAVGLAGSGVGWLDVTVAPADHGPASS